MAAKSAKALDRRIVLWVVAVMFAITLAFVFLGPKQEDNDPEPSTYNAGSQGTEAAYLLLSELGYGSERWESSETELHEADAAHSTLILTEPQVPYKETDRAPLRQAIADFLNRGGRVLATGVGGAELLPGGNTARPTRLIDGLCYTKPEGDGALAHAGQVAMAVRTRWEPSEAKFHVEQRCGNDAVVVRYAVGQGEAIWWASPMPLTNSGLRDDPSLKLVLASVGQPGRKVLFDEYLHSSHGSILDTLNGLPWGTLFWQLAAIALLLVFSFSRRAGPLRAPVYVPRTSPIEFAESMGRLYQKAGASHAATEAARGRVLDFLREQCGIPRDVLLARPPQVAQELTGRFGGSWSEIDEHLEQSAGATTSLAPKTTLRLVQSLEEDYRRLEGLIRTPAPASVVNR